MSPSTVHRNFIDDSNNSLLGVRDAINTAGASTGVSASIVTDASGSRLILSSSKTGEGNDIQIAASQDGVTQGANSLTALTFAAGNSTAQLPSNSKLKANICWYPLLRIGSIAPLFSQL